MYRLEKYNFKNGSIILYKNYDNSGEVIIYKNKKIYFKKYYKDFNKANNVFYIMAEWLEREIKDTIKTTLLDIKKEFSEKENEDE